jgi:NAD(P)-dependent dehydrogenase (short-subunit alcohol dehydrogenase family)
MEKRFIGKITLVTGAGSGIGKSVALRFAQEGAVLAVVDIGMSGLSEIADAIAGMGGKVLPIQTDISKVDDIRRMVEKVVAEYGRIDIVVNCAGVVQSKDLLDVTEEDWDRIIDINQKGTAFTCQLAGAQMVKQVPEAVRKAGKPDASYGKIVNFSSISGRRGRSFQVHYASSKAAVISITQSAALAFAPYGINVNAVSPSVVVTPMWETSITQKAKTLGIDKQAATDEMINRIPLRRAGKAEEIAAVAAFLCSEEADFITGQTINVDGGFEMN